MGKEGFIDVVTWTGTNNVYPHYNYAVALMLLLYIFIYIFQIAAVHRLGTWINGILGPFN